MDGSIDCDIAVPMLTVTTLCEAKEVALHFLQLSQTHSLVNLISYTMFCCDRIYLGTYRVYSNRTQAKKIISNLVCAQLESKQFQEVNFLPLIRCCVVIDL